MGTPTHPQYEPNQTPNSKRRTFERSDYAVCRRQHSSFIRTPWSWTYTVYAHTGVPPTPTFSEHNGLTEEHSTRTFASDTRNSWSGGGSGQCDRVGSGGCNFDLSANDARREARGSDLVQTLPSCANGFQLSMHHVQNGISGETRTLAE